MISRVAELVTAERKQLERQRYEEERLARGEAAATAAVNGTGNGNGTTPDGDGDGVTDKNQVPTGPLPEIERGLCVICQDAEATLAVVDCGYVRTPPSLCAHMKASKC